MKTNYTKDTEKLRDSRFINKLKSSHYVITPTELLFGYKELTAQEKFFYSCLVHYGNISVANGNVTEDGHPVVYPSQRRLAEEIDLSQSTISRYTKKLAEAGLVKINDQGSGRHNWVTLYTPGELRQDKETPELPVPDKLTQPTRKDYQPQRVQDILAQQMARKPKTRQPKKKTPAHVPDRRNSKTMADYFSSRYLEKFGGTAPLMSGKEYKHFKDLIDHYGYDKVTQFVDYTIDYYDAFRRDKRLTGPPTAGIIYGFRAYLEEKAAQYYGNQKEAQSVTEPDEGFRTDSAW